MTTLKSNLTPGSAISPIDGRYREKTAELAKFFSEQALMKYRLLVEVEYLIVLSQIAGIIRPITEQEIIFLRSLYGEFSDEQFLMIKDLEKTTNHDVNSVIRYFKEVLKDSSLKDLIEFVHFGLTSEDVNNLSFAFMLRGGTSILLDHYQTILSVIIDSMVSPHEHTPLLARTHGQPASPTTVGWEMNVFAERIRMIISEIQSFNILVKFGGATGGHNALNVAYPEIDWRFISRVLVGNLNKIEKTNMEMIYNPYTTQIESHDTYAQLFADLSRVNTVLVDFARDMWMYIALEVFTQKPVKGEDGSSAMPNKVNPIDFENAEGNLGIANALLHFFISELPVSRMQRHLTDSTIIRNFGPAYAHVLISLKALKKGIGKLYVNIDNIKKTLDENWSVVAEAYQTILRREGVSGGYDILKELTRGKRVTEELLHNFVDQLAEDRKLSTKLIEELKSITPHSYTGNRCIK